jgi:hypothetical protein
MIHLHSIADASGSKRAGAFHENAPVAVAWVWAALFALMGVVGFVPEPLALLFTNSSHSVVHVKTAAAFAGVALAGNAVSTWFTRTFGGFYLAVVVVGFILSAGTPSGCLLGLTDLHGPDNILHFGLGAGILASGCIATMRI